MKESSAAVSGLPNSARLLARHALTAGQNRLELLEVELQEEKVTAFHAIGLLLALAALAVLAGIAFSFTFVVLLWDHSRVWPIAVLMVLYSGGGALVYCSLKRRLDAWRTLPETLSLLRRDCTAISRHLQ